MKHTVAMKWVAALRSGKYSQAKYSLQDRHGFCCLGVLCEVAKAEGIEVLADRDGMLAGTELGSQRYVKEWAGVKSSNGNLPKKAVASLPAHLRENPKIVSLAEFNDRGNYNFKQLANLIEKYWRSL